MANKSPLARVKESFGEKAKLVEAVKGFVNSELWIPRTNQERGGDKGLEHVSNAKLLRLLSTFSEVKEKFGTRAKLVDAILDALKRTKDAGFKKRIEAYPVPRLYDLYKSSVKRAKRGAKAAVETAKPAIKAAKKATAKKVMKKETK